MSMLDYEKCDPSCTTIEILDLECVLCHVTGVQNENKNGRGFIGYPKGRNTDIKLVN